MKSARPTIENVLVWGVSAVVFINVGRLIALPLSQKSGPVGAIGTALGKVLTFGGTS